MKTILFVEDDGINQAIVKGMLNKMGYSNIQFASTAAQALDLLENPGLKIDAILMDLGLPDMDGVELTKKIRASSLTAKGVPIIAITGNSREKAKEESLAAGMNAFLTKPVKREILESTLSEFLND